MYCECSELNLPELMFLSQAHTNHPGQDCPPEPFGEGENARGDCRGEVVEQTCRRWPRGERSR